MSQEHVEVVRGPLRANDHSRRTFDTRVVLRFPWVAAASARMIARLPPTSRLRQAVVRRVVRLGMEAYNRRDLEAVASTWDPECEYRPGRQWVEAGMAESCYRGLSGYRKYVAATEEVWGVENLLQPVELIDMGMHLVTLAEGRMRAQASGIPLSEAFALVSTLQDGRPIRHQEYYSHAEALKAVGLEE